MKQVIIIGTRPPCPRCKLLGEAAQALVAELGQEARVEHYSYTDPEAVDIARKEGLQAGTAKDVARLLSLSLDIAAFSQIIGNKAREENREYLPYNSGSWSKEMDEFLYPYQEKAAQAGILMTPVLVIDGIVRHSGSVPRLAQLKQWIEE